MFLPVSFQILKKAEPEQNMSVKDSSSCCRVPRVRKASWQKAVWLNILEARVNSRFYRGLLKLYSIHSSSGS